MSVHLAGETAGKGLGKVQVGTSGANAQVNKFAFGRHVAFNISHCIRTVIGSGVDVYLFFFLVPCNVGTECSHASMFKFKLSYRQCRISLKVAEDTS